MAKSKTYALYLAKESVTAFDDILTETAKDKIGQGEVEIRHSKIDGEDAVAYIFKSTQRDPTWLPDIKKVFNPVPEINNKSSCAVVFFKTSERIFATPFAHGWQYIDEAKIESDFGLKVAINSVSDGKLRRVDRNHLGQAMKGVSQSSFQRDLSAFGIDEALDLIRRVSGGSDGEGLANSVTGSTALKFTKEMDLTEISEVAAEALKRYNSVAYKSTAFQIIDKVRPVGDPILMSQLDLQAVEILKSDQNNFELSMPGWSENDVVYYGLYGSGLKGRYPDLLVANYRSALGDDLDKLTVEDIASRHGVLAEFNDDVGSKKRWTIKKALIGSLVWKSGLYAISEGEWYRLDQQFKNEVDAAFENLKKSWEKPPLKIIKKVSDDGKKSGYESELEFNQRTAAEFGQICLDQEIISVASIPYGRFEACDLLDVEKKKLIHVKKSSRQSSILSHFFKQGSNSAQILRLYPEAREALVARVKKVAGQDTAKNLAEAMGSNLNGWTIEFHIVDAPRPDGSFAIPFFSRITLRDEARALGGMEFGIGLLFIPT